MAPYLSMDKPQFFPIRKPALSQNAYVRKMKVVSVPFESPGAANCLYDGAKKFTALRSKKNGCY